MASYSRHAEPKSASTACGVSCKLFTFKTKSPYLAVDLASSSPGARVHRLLVDEARRSFPRVGGHGARRLDGPIAGRARAATYAREGVIMSSSQL
jgi:hypothetical protein